MDDNRKLVDPMEFMRYDRISDDVLFLGDGTSLRFTVCLSRDRHGRRGYYYHEYEYPSKFSGESTLISIKRSYDYYLSFENGGKPDGSVSKTFIRIGLGQFILMHNALENVAKWYTDKKYAKLYIMADKQLTLTSGGPSEKVVGLPSNKYIEFVPIVIDKGLAAADKEPGVRMYLNDMDNYSDLTMEKLFALVYIFRTFNMYQSAQAMLNFVGRPPVGSERVQLGEARGRKLIYEEKEYNPTGVTSRRVYSMKNKSNIANLE